MTAHVVRDLVSVEFTDVIFLIHYDVTDKNNNVKVLKVSITDHSIGLTAILVMSVSTSKLLLFYIYIYINLVEENNLSEF
jgi:hypothetical protein